MSQIFAGTSLVVTTAELLHVLHDEIRCEFSHIVVVYYSPNVHCSLKNFKPFTREYFAIPSPNPELQFRRLACNRNSMSGK